MSMRYPAGFISAFYNPLQNPNAPTIGTASPASATSLSIAFTAPSNVGGSAITSFIATARRTSDGVLFSASGSASPITITGLTEVAFTVTVVAVNSYGPSALSAASNSVTPAMQPGDAYAGGFFAGQISTTANGIATHNLVVAPLSGGQFTGTWKTTNTTTAGTGSVIDGPANTAAMIAAGAAEHPCAQFCNNLNLGGFSDWYMPAQNELEVCYFNLKPTTESNATSSGTNNNAVPGRGNYTAGIPAQTTANTFKTGNANAFSVSQPNRYWSSTEISAVLVKNQVFQNGLQFDNDKNGESFVRAIRRVPV